MEWMRRWQEKIFQKQQTSNSLSEKRQNNANPPALHEVSSVPARQDPEEWADARREMFGLYDQLAKEGAKDGESISFENLHAGERVYHAGQIRAQEDLQSEKGMFVSREPWESASYLGTIDGKTDRDGNVIEVYPERVLTSFEVVAPTRLVKFPDVDLNTRTGDLKVPSDTSFERCKNVLFKEWAEDRFGSKEPVTGFYKPIDLGAEILLSRPEETASFRSQCSRALGEEFAEKKKREAGLVEVEHDQEER